MDYTRDQIDKLGNGIIFLCEKMGPLPKTKLLKLLFLIEELSVKKYGLPVFGLRFDVWKLGPVPEDLFYELSSEPNILKKYIGREFKNSSYVISPKIKFSDDEFNDIELRLLEDVAARFKKQNSYQLIHLTHREHSLWHRTASENGLIERFNKGLTTSSDVQIDFLKAIEGEPDKVELYNSHKEFLEQIKRLKS